MDPFYQFYFFGEAVPPYVDVLGQAAFLRSTDDNSVKYQSFAKCYRNMRRFGSVLYQRLADYYGPQFGIQTGKPHQGYGDEDAYDEYFGKGSLYIDLPHSRVFDAAFNCTPGFQVPPISQPYLPLPYPARPLLASVEVSAGR